MTWFDYEGYFNKLLHLLRPEATGHNWFGPGNPVPPPRPEVVDLADSIARDHDIEYESIQNSDLSSEDFRQAIAAADRRAVDKFVQGLKSHGFNIWLLVGASALNLKQALDITSNYIVGKPIYPQRYVTLQYFIFRSLQ